MDKILDDVRRDAIRKMNSAIGEDRQPLIDAIKIIIRMSNIARKEGMMALEGVVLEGEMEYMKNFFFLITGCLDNLDYILEMATNEYWIRNLQGIQAMLFYIYLQGIICIFLGYNPRIILDIYISLLPEDCRTMLDKEELA